VTPPLGFFPAGSARLCGYAGVGIKEFGITTVESGRIKLIEACT
jgi:hypothetical protein